MKQRKFLITFRDKRDGRLRQWRSEGTTKQQAASKLLERFLAEVKESERILCIASGNPDLFPAPTTIDDFQVEPSKAIDPKDKSKPLVIDWQSMGWPQGTMVKRSAHWMKERCMKGQPQVGIVVGFDHYEDANGLVNSWPTVKWEGASTSGVGSTHPMNVNLYRKKERDMAPMVVMNLEKGEYHED